ncbi:uncharacterized protein LOC119274694 [Triticum dicoccoides]|uniref:uncharacterized protein LOC119274694 n=1 Tax=Triticum dicoccoides TaxID=85692 RepID=UPI00188E105B|nr:uncharacterized protein LOC119274694 [Triticum dicoccoides]
MPSFFVSDMGRSRARARQPLSNISMLALPRSQEPLPFFSSLPRSRDGHGRPMPERRRPRTRRHLDPLHAISISPETCTKSHPAPSPPFGPRPVALQPERFNRLVPQAEERSSLPRASLTMANQQADPASFLFLPPRRITPSLSPTTWTPTSSSGPYPAVENAVKQFN